MREHGDSQSVGFMESLPNADYSAPAGYDYGLNPCERCSVRIRPAREASARALARSAFPTK